MTQISSVVGRSLANFVEGVVVAVPRILSGLIFLALAYVMTFVRKNTGHTGLTTDNTNCHVSPLKCTGLSPSIAGLSRPFH